MKKVLVISGLSLIVLLAVGVFVAAVDLVVIDEEGIVESPKITDTVLNYIETFLEKRDVVPESIATVREVDFDNLPKEVNIENVGDHNLAIYEINYTEDAEEKKVLSASSKESRQPRTLALGFTK